MTSTSLATPADTGSREVAMGFMNGQSFELMQRAARMLSNSTLVPSSYRATIEKKAYNPQTKNTDITWEENPSAISNCVVALNMAARMGADPLMVMQNLYIVEGRPSWSSQWIIAAINGCGRFSPLRFDLTDLGQQEVEYSTSSWETGENGRRQKVDRRQKVVVQNLQCIAWAVEKATGERIESPRVTIDMAVKEGWYGKTGSKWQTMPEVMLRYRTASFFGKLYAPELLMGMQSTEEEHDILTLGPDGTVDLPGKPEVAMPRARAETAYRAMDAVNTAPAGPVDQETGEIAQQAQQQESAPAATEQQQAAPAAAQEPKPEPAATAPAAAAQAPRKPAAAAQPGVLATEGERKFILNRVRSNELDLAELIEKAGLDPLPADLAGLTKDGFVALKDQLPPAV